MKSPENGPIVVHFQRLRGDALLPKYQTDGSAGMDLAACPPERAPVEIPAGEIRMIPTGWACAIPHGYEGQVRPRSGLAAKHGVTVPNAPGTIDSDYRGELIVALINHGKQTFTIEPGMRIAQLVIAPVSRAQVMEVESLPGTARGAGGFGSTGA